MSADDQVKLTDHLPQIMAAFHAFVAKSLADAAQAAADEYASNAPKASGFMASSAYIKTRDKSTYGQNVSGNGPLLPEVEAPEQDTDAIAAVAADYAGYVEYGTVHAAAQPAFTPALDTAMSKLGDALAAMEQAIAGEGIEG